MTGEELIIGAYQELSPNDNVKDVGSDSSNLSKFFSVTGKGIFLTVSTNIRYFPYSDFIKPEINSHLKTEIEKIYIDKGARLKLYTQPSDKCSERFLDLNRETVIEHWPLSSAEEFLVLNVLRGKQ